MSKKIYLPILLSALVGSMVGCNSSDDDTEYTFTESSSVLVSGFSLANDSKVLDSLANVFFSIDLEGGRIFNADSMPYGTDITHLIPQITTPSTASEVTLKFFSTEAQRDSVVDYLTNSTDSIDFSYGPVSLIVKSQSGLATKTYEIRVNVHQVKADSLAWYKLESAPLPTSFGSITSQCATRCGNTFYCLTSDGTSFCLATTVNPSDSQWQTSTVTFPFTPNVESLRASDSNLFILSADGDLYTSTDFSSWTATGENWHYIYGAYGNQIIGSKLDNSQYKVTFYPSGVQQSIPAGFPIEGTTLPASYTTTMGAAAQLVMLGGRNANGELVKGAWSYDGSNWANITSQPIEQALEHMTMVPYSLINVPISTWAPESYPALLALGGRTADGTINRTVYYSRDWGMTWREAPSLVQLPEEMPSFYGAAAFEYNTTMYAQSRSAAAWHEFTLRALPKGASFLPFNVSSRAVAPITQWECPAIFLFGGKNSQGNTIDNMWRGVIYQYTFLPVQ